MFRFSGTVPANVTVSDWRTRGRRWQLAHGSILTLACPLLLEHDPGQLLVAEIQLAEGAAGWTFDCWIGGPLAQRVAREHRAKQFGVSPWLYDPIASKHNAEGIEVITRIEIAELSIVAAPALALTQLRIA